MQTWFQDKPLSYKRALWLIQRQTNLFRRKINFLDHITVIYLRISYQIADLKPESGFLARKIWFRGVLDMRNRFGAAAKGSLQSYNPIEAIIWFSDHEDLVSGCSQTCTIDSEHRQMGPYYLVFFEGRKYHRQMAPWVDFFKNPCIFMKMYWKVIKIHIRSKLTAPDRLVPFRVTSKHPFMTI